MRYALYYTPPWDEPLAMAAANWLGRDAFSGLAMDPPRLSLLDGDEIHRLTEMPRRYGFHGTLMAPFRLADGYKEENLLSAIQNFCAAAVPFVPGSLVLDRIGPFFALVFQDPDPALAAFAGEVVKTFDGFRTPLDEAEIERRNPDKLTPSQLKNLHRWGYPYVFEDFRFHMTLTSPVEADDAAKVEEGLKEWFGAFLGDQVEIGSLSLFVEPGQGAPFTVHSNWPLAAQATRKSA